MKRISILVLSVALSHCAAFGFSNRVLWRVPSPDQQLMAVCQEIPELDGPSYNVRLEQPNGALVRQLYDIGDGDPCSEVVWSPDGRKLVVMSGHVARIRIVDVQWALSHPAEATGHWSWRMVDLSTAQRHLQSAQLRFVSPTAIEVGVCAARPGKFTGQCVGDTTIQRLDIANY